MAILIFGVPQRWCFFLRGYNAACWEPLMNADGGRPPARLTTGLMTRLSAFMSVYQRFKSIRHEILCKSLMDNDSKKIVTRVECHCATMLFVPEKQGYASKVPIGLAKGSSCVPRSATSEVSSRSCGIVTAKRGPFGLRPKAHVSGYDEEPPL